MEQFLAWFQGIGGHVHPKLDLFARLPGGDRGVVATEDIAEGTVLVTVPHDITIHAPTSHQLSRSDDGMSRAWAYLSKEHPGTSPFLSSVLVLLSEMALGQQSKLFPYIQCLPDSCDCLLNWTEEDKKGLKGTTIENTGEGPEEVFQREVIPRMAGMPQLWPAPYDSLPQFLRVASLVQSRAFHMEEENWVTGTHQEGTELFLIPAIDMINHSTDPQLRNSTLHSYKIPGTSAAEGERPPGSPEAFFSMKAEKPIKAGEQVLHSYGDLSDAQLVQTYGFIDISPPSGKKQAGVAEGLPSNPQNCTSFSWEVVVAACRSALASASQGDKEELQSFDSSVTTKLNLLSSAGTLPPGCNPQKCPQAPSFTVAFKEPLPDILMTTLQVLLMAESDVEELQLEYEQSRTKKQRKRVAGSSASAPTAAPPLQPLLLGTRLLDEDEAFAQVVALALIQLVDKSIHRYPSSQKEDEQALKHGTFQSQRSRLALLIRIGERQVMQEIKKKALAILMGAPAGDDEEGEDEEGEEDEDEEDDEGEEGEDD